LAIAKFSFLPRKREVWKDQVGERVLEGGYFIEEIRQWLVLVALILTHWAN
jgi:hypothetical protein